MQVNREIISRRDEALNDQAKSADEFIKFAIDKATSLGMNQSIKDEIKGELYKVSSSPDQQQVDQLPMFIKDENYQKILSQFQNAPENIRQEIQSKYQEFLEKHQELSQAYQIPLIQNSLPQISQGVLNLEAGELAKASSGIVNRSDEILANIDKFRQANNTSFSSEKWLENEQRFVGQLDQVYRPQGASLQEQSLDLIDSLQKDKWRIDQINNQFTTYTSQSMQDSLGIDKTIAEGNKLKDKIDEKISELKELRSEVSSQVVKEKTDQIIGEIENLKIGYLDDYRKSTKLFEVEHYLKESKKEANQLNQQYRDQADQYRKENLTANSSPLVRELRDTSFSESSKDPTKFDEVMSRDILKVGNIKQSIEQYQGELSNRSDLNPSQINERFEIATSIKQQVEDYEVKLNDKKQELISLNQNLARDPSQQETIKNRISQIADELDRSKEDFVSQYSRMANEYRQITEFPIASNLSSNGAITRALEEIKSLDSKDALAIISEFDYKYQRNFSNIDKDKVDTEMQKIKTAVEGDLPSEKLFSRNNIQSKLLGDQTYVRELLDEVAIQRDKFSETIQAIDRISQGQAISQDLQDLKDSANKIIDSQNVLNDKLTIIDSLLSSSQKPSTDQIKEISTEISDLQQKRMEFIDKYDKSIDSSKIDDKLIGKEISEIKNFSGDLSPLKQIIRGDIIDPQMLITNKDQIITEIRDQNNRITSVSSVINEALIAQPDSDIFKELKNSAQSIDKAQSQLLKQIQEMDLQNPNAIKVDEIVTQAKEIMKQQEEFVKKYEFASDIKTDFVKAIDQVDNLQSLIRNPSTSQDQIALDQLAQNQGNLNPAEIQQFNDIKDRVKIIADNFEITFGKKINDASLTGNIQNALISGGVPMLADNFQNDQSSNLTKAQETEFRSKQTLASLTAKMTKLEIKMKEFELSQGGIADQDQRRIRQEISELRNKESNANRLLEELNSRLTS